MYDEQLKNDLQTREQIATAIKSIKGLAVTKTRSRSDSSGNMLNILKFVYYYIYS